MKIPLFSTLLIFLVPGVTQAGSASWNVNPATSDWNTAANWTPNTVPNGPTDTATFPSSNKPNPVIQTSIELNELVFSDHVLTTYTILVGQAGGQQVGSLTLSGSGIVNNSDASTQALQATPTLATNGSPNLIALRNDAALPSSEQGFWFLTALGGASAGLVGGEIQFFDNSTAGSAAVEADKGQNGGGAGQVSFFGNSSAGEAQVVNIAGAGASAPGVTVFQDQATAGSAVVTNYAASIAGVEGGTTFFLGSSSAGDSIIFAYRGVTAGAGGGTVIFSDTASADNSILDADGESAASGTIQFLADSSGGTAQVIGDGDLVITNHNPPGVTIGLIEGFGNVFLGSNELTVGSSNITDFGTTYYGTIQGSGGSLVKVGTGLLTLSGANTYTGGTFVNAGELRVVGAGGSPTGTGPIQVNGGTLSGKALMTGAITVGKGDGAGAVFAPGGQRLSAILGSKRSLTFRADGSYMCVVNSSTTTAATAIGNGITIDPAALFALSDTGGNTLPAGTGFTVINNTSAGAISGAFANLPEGGTIAAGPNTYQATYQGGDGNDLTLTVL